MLTTGYKLWKHRDVEEAADSPSTSQFEENKGEGAYIEIRRANVILVIYLVYPRQQPLPEYVDLPFVIHTHHLPNNDIIILCIS